LICAINWDFLFNFFLATEEDNFRKPSPDMFNIMVANYNNNLPPDDECFYCGDSAGRPASKIRKKKDFACSDRKFAYNIPIKFYTPEHYFLNKEEEDFEWGFNPVEYLEKIKDRPKLDTDKILIKEKELVILVGLPSSGKTTFAEKYFVPNGYIRIYKDTDRTIAKCKTLAKEYLEEGKSIVFDNTNPSKKSRQEFISIAKSLNVRVRCFNFCIPTELAEHLNFVRYRYTKGKSKLTPVVSFRTFKTHYEEPSLKEGFSDMYDVNFHPDFPDQETEKLFKQFSDKSNTL